MHPDVPGGWKFRLWMGLLGLVYRYRFPLIIYAFRLKAFFVAVMALAFAIAIDTLVLRNSLPVVAIVFLAVSWVALQISYRLLGYAIALLLRLRIVFTRRQGFYVSGFISTAYLFVFGVNLVALVRLTPWSLSGVAIVLATLVLYFFAVATLVYGLFFSAGAPGIRNAAATWSVIQYVLEPESLVVNTPATLVLGFNPMGEDESPSNQNRIDISLTEMQDVPAANQGQMYLTAVTGDANFVVTHLHDQVTAKGKIHSAFGITVATGVRTQAAFVIEPKRSGEQRLRINFFWHDSHVGQFEATYMVHEMFLGVFPVKKAVSHFLAWFLFIALTALPGVTGLLSFFFPSKPGP